MSKKSASDYEKQSKTSSNPETAPAEKKKHSSGDQERDHRAHSESDLGRPGSEVAQASAAGGGHSIQAPSGSSSWKANPNDQTKYTDDSYPNPEEHDSDDEDEKYGMCGFTSSEVDELVCHGVKPWDDDAWDFLDALHNAYREYDALEMLPED